jgi:hypothetical protein
VSSKEDILEQLVEEYLIHKGYFVRHNVKFRPNRKHAQFESKKDSNHSDIDILAYNPKQKGHKRVLVVSCKSWQSGFNPKSKIEQILKNKIVNGREAWKGFRELVSPKWSEALLSTIQVETGCNSFTYITAVTKLIGSASPWENHPHFAKALEGNPIKVLTLLEMLQEVYPKLSTTVAGTELGRTLQLFRAAGVKI